MIVEVSHCDTTVLNTVDTPPAALLVTVIGGSVTVSDAQLAETVSVEIIVDPPTVDTMVLYTVDAEGACPALVTVTVSVSVVPGPAGPVTVTGTVIVFASQLEADSTEVTVVTPPPTVETTVL